MATWDQLGSGTSRSNSRGTGSNNGQQSLKRKELPDGNFNTEKNGICESYHSLLGNLDQDSNQKCETKTTLYGH